MGHFTHLLKERIRILVGDTTPMQCELMARALRGEHDFHVVAMASDSGQILRHVVELRPSVALVSANLQDGPAAGFKVVAEAHAKRSLTQCVMLLDRSDRRLVVAAFRNGARGVFFRAQLLEQLRKCIRIVKQGQIWANTAEMNYIVEALGGPGLLYLLDTKGNSVLTQREAEVTRLVAEALTNRGIAEKLRLSEHTVKNYIFRIFEKTGVSSRVGLVLYALSQQELARGQTP